MTTSPTSELASSSASDSGSRISQAATTKQPTSTAAAVGAAASNTATAQRSKRRDSHKAKRSSSSSTSKSRSRETEHVGRSGSNERSTSFEAPAKALIRQCMPEWLMALPASLLCPHCRQVFPLGNQPTVESFHAQYGARDSLHQGC